MEVGRGKRRKETTVKEPGESETEQKENFAVEIEESSDKMIDVWECAKILGMETDQIVTLENGEMQGYCYDNGKFQWDEGYGA